MQFHRGKVVLLGIDKLREQETTAEQKRALHEFYEARRARGFEIVRIGYKSGIPFFITKSYVEKRAREALDAAGSHSLFIVDWENTLREQITASDDAMFYVIDKHGVVRAVRKGWIVLDDDLARLVDGLLNE